MATVHPSRLGLVPVATRSQSLRGGDEPRERERRERENDGERYRARNGDREGARDRDRGRRDDSWSRDRSRERDRDGGDKHKHNDRDTTRSRTGRRSSPQYDDYRGRRQAYKDDNNGASSRSRSRPVSPHRSQVRDGGRDPHPPPWRDQGNSNAGGNGNMYASRGERGRSGPGFGGGDDFFASRRKQRETMSISIWPKSPERPSDERSPTRNTKKSGKRRRSRSETPSSEDEKDKRKRDKRSKRKEHQKDKDRSRDRKEKSRHRSKRSDCDDDSEEERDRRRHRRKHRSRYSDDEDDYERGHDRSRRRRSRHRDSKAPSTPARSRSPHKAEDEEEWVEKPSESFISHLRDRAVSSPDGAQKIAAAVGNNGSLVRGLGAQTVDTGEYSDDEYEVGPQPVYREQATKKRIDERVYGGQLLRGEGSAMAAFLQDGDTDMRIPRRGEIGLTSDQIAAFETVGYVMSGSRHKRMNAVRMRKENQVISAEEKRSILKLQKEERERREAILRDEFRDLVEEKLKEVPGAALPEVGEDSDSEAT